MSALYRIPLETELAYLEKKLKGADAAVMMGVVRACYALAEGGELGEAAAQPIMLALAHPEPAVWGPAFVYVQPLLPRFPELQGAVQGLMHHADPAVRLRLLHWQMCPATAAHDEDEDWHNVGLRRLLADAVAEVRFDTVLLMHQAPGGASETRWLRGTVLPQEACPEVRALITAVLAFRAGGPAVAARTPRLQRVSMDRLPGGRLPGAWLSMTFEPEVLLHERLDCPPNQECSYDRLPGQAHHARWCEWRDGVRWTIQKALALAAEAETESGADADLVLDDVVIQDLARIEERDYRQAYCPVCGVVYDAAQMLHSTWQDGHEPLAMVGGIQIHCPARHLLFMERTWRS